MKRIKSKSGKKSQDISVRWKVSDWVGDLHTDKNDFLRSSKPFDFLNRWFSCNLERQITMVT